MHNLVDLPEYKELVDSLHQQLLAELEKIGEAELFPREYYISKWGYEIEKNNINYWSFKEGKGKVQTPAPIPGL
jgi:hypothetical protein